MKKTETKTIIFVAGLIALIICCSTIAYVIQLNSTIKNLQGQLGLSFTTGSVHTKISIAKDGQVILSEYHAGAVTNLGLNATLAKLTGDDSFYNMTQYNLNCTYVGIGNQGTLNTGSVILPGEWNRTSAVIHNQAYNHFNLTAVFYPDAGPYTADCIGIYYEAAGNSLWGYDTFSEVSGIDDTYTITVEIIVSAS